MGDTLDTGEQIGCPFGDAARCGSAVYCKIEDKVLEKYGPETQDRSIRAFCTGEHQVCPTFRSFKQFERTQSEEARRQRRALEVEEDYDYEILEELDGS